MITGYHAVYENDFFEGIDNANRNGFNLSNLIWVYLNFF